MYSKAMKKKQKFLLLITAAVLIFLLALNCLYISAHAIEGMGANTRSDFSIEYVKETIILTEEDFAKHPALKIMLENPYEGVLISDDPIVKFKYPNTITSKEADEIRNAYGTFGTYIFYNNKYYQIMWWIS